MAYENLLYEVKERNRVHHVQPSESVERAESQDDGRAAANALIDARGDDSVRVVILTGAGEKAFVAGADIGELSQQTPVDGKEFSLYGQGVIHLLETLGKPSICAINGFALGGGCELALACTIRIASKTAKLGQPEVKLGIIPGIRRIAAAGAAVRKGRRARIVLDGRNDHRRRSAAHRAGESGYEPAELLPAAEAIAKKIIANAPLAVKYAMEAIEHGMEMPQEEGLFLEATLFGLCCATEDMREGTQRVSGKAAGEVQGEVMNFE